MRRPASVLLAFLVVLGCSEKPTRSVGANNDEEENNEPTPQCRVDNDCPDYHSCRNRQCEPGLCLDGVQSAGESDVDCGGPCEKCPDGGACLGDLDCASLICFERQCLPSGSSPNNSAPTCDDPGTSERFVRWENGIEADITYERNTRGAAPVTTSGIAVADFDGDGDADVMVTNQGAEPALFLNDGAGTFADVSATHGMTGLTRSTSLSVADFDGDGDPDVVMGRTEGGVYVLMNQGDGRFVDETSTRGIGQPTDVVSGGAFADFDADGDLDFYLANYLPPIEVQISFELPEPLPNRLYRNDGTGFFTEMAYSPGGAGEAGATLAATWWDFDADGRPDIWSSNDFGMIEGQRPNQLWRNIGPHPDENDGWLWEDVSAIARVDVAIFGMSASVADFDNDGDQDGYSGNMAQNVLHVVDGTSTTNEAVARGVDCSVLVDPRPAPLLPPEYEARLRGMQQFLDDYADADSGYYTLTSWAATFFDADHDGWQDLHVVNGSTLSDLTPEANFQPNYLFMNQGDGTFEQGPCWLIPDIRGTSRGAAAGDLDGDGDMDLIWSDQGDNGDAGVYVIRNEMATGNWLIFELEGQPPNTDAIGAKVTIAAGGLTQTRWIDGGQSYMSVSERVAHFGLGSADSVDSVTVTWPDGTTQNVSVLAVNQRIVIRR